MVADGRLPGAESPLRFVTISCRNGVDHLSNRRDELSLRISIVALRHGSSEAARYDAALELAEAGEAGVEVLLNGLADGDPGVRTTASEGLAHVNWRGVGDSFRDDARIWLKDALNDRDPLVRGSAAHALGRIGGEGVVEALTAASDDEVEEVRLAVAAALGRLDSAVDRGWDREPAASTGHAPDTTSGNPPDTTSGGPAASTTVGPAMGSLARYGDVPAAGRTDTPPAPRDDAPLRMIECPGCRRLAKPDAIRCRRCGSRLRP